MPGTFQSGSDLDNMDKQHITKPSRRCLTTIAQGSNICVLSAALLSNLTYRLPEG